MSVLEELAASYQEWHAAGASGPDPFEVMAHGGHSPALSAMPLGAWSADLECVHGNVPATPHAVTECYCFRSSSTPRPYVAITRQEAREVMAGTQTAPDATPEAPYGYKANGEARKRPVPHAAIAAKRNGGSNTKPAAPKRSTAISRQEAQALTTEPDSEADTLEKVARDIEAEISKLQVALDGVREAARG